MVNSSIHASPEYVESKFNISRSLELQIPIDSGLIFSFADFVLVCGREQRLLNLS